MTITQRLLRPYRSTAQNERIAPDEALDSQAVTNMLGILSQLGQLSQFAAEIFQGLFETASQTGQRISKLSTRVTGLEANTSQFEKHLKESPASYFYSNPRPVGKYVRSDDLSHSLLVSQTRPLSMQKARSEVEEVPKLNLLDHLTAEPALKKFSDPGFFLTEWIKAEQEKQTDMQEERKKRAERRKDKKMKENKPKRMVAKVEAVQVKQYSAQGAEYDAAMGSVSRPAVSSTPQEQLPRPALATPSPPSHSDDHAIPRPQLAPPPPAPAVPSPRGPGAPPAPPPPPQHRPTLSANMGGAPPPPPPMPMGGHGAPPPPPAPAIPSAPPAPPLAPSIPGAPPAPPAPPIPMAPSIPAAPAVFIPAPPPMADGGPMVLAPVPPGGAVPEESVDEAQAGAASLFDQIRSAGMKNLKKADAQSPERRLSGRGGLLSEIRNKNFQLKKVEKAAPSPAATAASTMPGGGGMASIMSILQRRAAIQGSDDEESEDDDWED